jgi:DNA repair protein RadC
MEHNRNLQMKNLPSDDRPYEKLERLGARGMTDAELLSVIIRSGTREISALQLGQKIMSSAGDRGLMMLLDSSLEELKEIPGIGRVKALQIKAALEIGNRTVEQARRSRENRLELLMTQKRCSRNN